MNVFTVIVTYNGLQWIEKCIGSVLEQSTVIVVDNHSSDATLAYIKDHFPEVIVLPQTVNRGFGFANNIGISYAIKQGADAVFLLNQDAFAGTNCIKKLVETSQKHNEYGIISPVHFNGDGSALDYSFQKLSYMSPLISDLITKNFTKDIYDFKFINAAAWFIPREVLYKVGGFDPLFFMYGEDDNYSQRVLYHGYKIGVVPVVTIFHDSNNSNYQLGDKGTLKYYNQFLNSVYVKFADINADNYKRLRKFKFYLLKKILFSLVIFKLGSALDYYNKYKKVKRLAIIKSVKKNKKVNPNYLDIH